MARLQWGHGSEAVETLTRTRPMAVPSVLLQWGHGSEAVETDVATGYTWLQGALQWGHGSEAVETKRWGWPSGGIS